MSNLDTALRLMIDAHAGQVDKGGQPYVLHPLRLMNRLESMDEKIVAILHDAVEDSDVSLDQLRDLGFSEHVVEAIDRLTKRSAEDYSAFITRISANALATRVKIADLRDNMDTSRILSFGPKDAARIQKYQAALRRLLETA